MENGVNQLSPLRPILGNGDPLIEFLRNGVSHSAPRKSVDDQPVENATPNQSVAAVAPGSWAYRHTCDVASPAASSPTKNPIISDYGRN